MGELGAVGGNDGGVIVGIKGGLVVVSDWGGKCVVDGPDNGLIDPAIVVCVSPIGETGVVVNEDKD